MTNFKPLRPVNERMWKTFYPTKRLESKLEQLTLSYDSPDYKVSNDDRKEMYLMIREIIYVLNARKVYELERGRTWDDSWESEEQIEEMREISRKQYNVWKR
jgi:hypothetical protein